MDLRGLPTSDLPVGLVLCGRYTLRCKLAEGAVASVYLAHDEVVGQDVALKVLDPLRGADPVGHARFAREFDVLSRLDHPSIARCFRLEAHADLEILVLEHVPGETLEARMTRGRVPVGEAIATTRAILGAVEACHRQGILHRDLKPANVVMDPARGPVVLDFGMAWFSTAANLTRTGAVIGSPHYLAPEAFASSLTDARLDIYAVGAMLFEMLTGRTVHLVESVAELAAAHLGGDPPRVSALRPGLPVGLDRVVARAIAPRPEERFATAGEMAQALRLESVGRLGAMQATLPCRQCGASLILDLEFCPSCGTGVAWRLVKGPYAVQATAVENVERTVRWLLRRHGGALATPPGLVARRLQLPPVPLVVGASRDTAEQVAAEAREAGCSTEVVRARAILGTRLRASDATAPEMASAAGLHLASVLALGTVCLFLGAAEFTYLLPGLLALAGVGVAVWYVRRPVLKSQEAHAAPSGHRRRDAVLRKALGALKTDRARRLAAGAVARAAPVLVDPHPLPREDQEVREALAQALEACGQVDAHAQVLRGRSRTRLAAELAEARARADLGDQEAVRRMVELEQERVEMVEVALAHDEAARRALEACASITGALAPRLRVTA
jgi:serine/threonine-protein kinase